MAYVYILKSLADLKRYIGSTTDLARRVYQHNKGHVISTKNRRPLMLIAYQECGTIQEAALLEKKYKNSHDFLGRMVKAGKVKLINGGD